MISWWNLFLLFLCLCLCTLHLAEANCDDTFLPEHWNKPNVGEITLDTLTERFPLNDADSFEDVIKCTLGSKITKGDTESYMVYLKAWFECFYVDEAEAEAEDAETFMKASNCRELPHTVSFLDLMCLVAKASNRSIQIDACSHDVVVELYSRFYKTPIATTLPTTKQPPTATQLTTTTATSTTEEKSSKNSPPPVTTWSTRPSASSTASLSPAGVVAGTLGYNKNKEVKDTAVYSLLGLSVLLNLALAFCVALLCSQRKSNQGTSGSENFHLEAVMNRHLENVPLQSSDPESHPINT